MKNDPKYLPSRREFLQLAAALTASSALPVDGRTADTDGSTRSDPAADSSLSPGQQVHQTLNLNGTWAVTALPLDVEGDAGYKTFTQTRGEQLAAQVPGEIHLDLMRVGRMDDPNVSDNARTRCRWPEQHSWWYRTEFSAPPGFRKNQRQRLVFEGIDLLGQVFINGKLSGTAKNAFTPLVLDVKPLLQDRSNELVVRVTSGMELVPPAALDDNGFGKTNPIYDARYIRLHRFIRKPDYAAYGTDWNDPLPNIGIWRDVRLEGRSKVVIHHVRLDTAIRGKEVSLEGDVTIENLHPWSEIRCVLELRVDPPQGKPIVQRLSIGANVGRATIPRRIVIPDAQLWWPNGMGGQPLYRLTARILCGEEETDRQVQTIGLRTIELDRSPLPEGSRFCFRVNGQVVYGKGGNWAPADLIPGRIEPARYQKLVAEAQNANFNMFRVNGVGLYESDNFYDACDRAGILVWQDFTFSDAMYPDTDPEFLGLVRAEAEAAVRSLRHHASLALWVGNSECNWLFMAQWKRDTSKPQDFGGVIIYNEVLPDAIRFYDPARPYIASSPIGGTEPGGEIAGDRHGPYGMIFQFDELTTPLTDEERKKRTELNQRTWRQQMDKWHSRFVSEFGSLAPPNMASIREYLKPDELSRESRGWKIHTNMFDVGEGVPSAVADGISYHYGDPSGLSLPQFVLYGQMFQAQLQGGFVEAMRFRKDDPKDECQGVLSWSYNDCWGEMGWSIVDHYVRRKASFYWFRRAAAPVKVLVRSRGDHLITRVVNDTLKRYQAEVHCGWVRLDGKAREFEKHPVAIPANGMIEVTSVPFPSSSERNPHEWLYAATLTGGGIPDDQAIWLFAPHRELALGKPEVSTAIKNGVLEVSSAVYCHGVRLEDDGHEILADNYFELIPGVSQRIPITVPVASGNYSLTAVMPVGS